MKTLVIGFLVFSAWSAVATHLYVCKIKGLCNETGYRQTEMVSIQAITDTDTTNRLLEPVADSPGTMLVYFNFDKYEFTADAMTERYIEKSNSYMKQNPNAVLLMVGHTDAIGTDAYNLALGERRAQAIKSYFGSRGINADKSITESKGEKEPVDDNNTSRGRAKNRRTEITIK